MSPASDSDIIPRPDKSPAAATHEHAGQQPAGWIGQALAALGAIVSLLYLSNLGFGLAEVLPDNLPGAGNIDEFLFSLLLLFCLQKLGIHLPFLRGASRQGDIPRDGSPPQRATRT